MLESIAADECLDIEQVQVKFANLVQLQVMDVISIPFRDRWSIRPITAASKYGIKEGIVPYHNGSRYSDYLTT